MTEEAIETPEAPQEGEQQAQESKTFDAEYVDKLRKESAKYRTEAKANAEAAKRLADIEESQKSEQQKSADRVAALEKQVADAETRVLRANIATEHGISAADRDLFLTGADEEKLTAQAKRLAERESERKKQGNYVPNEGKPTTTKATDADRRSFVRQLTGRD